MSPATDNVEVSELAKIPINADGFFLEAHVKLRPGGLRVGGHLPVRERALAEDDDGEHPAGASGGRPRGDDPEQEDDGGRRPGEPRGRSQVRVVPDLREGLPVRRAGSERVERQEPRGDQAAKCMGCGSCASACPAKAIQLQHFTDKQVEAAIEALLEAVTR